MDWALEFDGDDDVATTNSLIANPIPIGGKMVFEGVYYNNNQSFQMFFNTYNTADNSRDFFSFNDTGKLQVRIAEASIVGGTVLTDGDTFTYEIARGASSYTHTLNDVTQGVTLKSDNVDAMRGFSNSSYRTKVAIRRCYLVSSDGVTITNNWDATASSHAAGTPILTDTIGGNDATGANMPTDGSAWLDLGGATPPTAIDLVFTDTIKQVTADSITISNISVLDLSGNTTQPTADSLLITTIEQLIFSDNVLQLSADTLTLSTVDELLLHDNVTQVTGDSFAIENVTQLSMASNVTQPLVDSIAIEQVGYLSFSDNARSPTVDTLTVELYTELEFDSTIRQVTADSIVLTTKTMPIFGNNDLLLIDMTVSYSLIDNSTDYKAI